MSAPSDRSPTTGQQQAEQDAQDAPAVFNTWMLTKWMRIWGVFAAIMLVTGLVILAGALGVMMGVSRAAPTALEWSLVAATALAPLLLCLGLRQRWCTRLSLGTDGVLIRRKGQQRYVRYADIAQLQEPEPTVLRLTLRSGEHVDVYTGKGQAITGVNLPLSYSRQKKLISQLRDRLESVQQQPDSSDESVVREAVHNRAHANLAPTDQDKSPFRTAPPPDEQQLWQVLRSPRATSAQRAAAVALLKQQGAEVDRPRLRIATEGMVDPHLRKFLRVATDDVDDSELCQALKELEDAASDQSNLPTQRAAS